MPDYIFCPINHMPFCKQMKTLLLTDIVCSSGLIPPQNLPDHSILQGTFITSFAQSRTISSIKNISSSKTQPTETKRNLKNINFKTFFMRDDIHQEVLKTIKKLEKIGLTLEGNKMFIFKRKVNFT